jgi:hypothetical protein
MHRPTCGLRARQHAHVGGVSAAMDIVDGAFHSFYLLEWMTTALFLCCVCMLGAGLTEVRTSLEKGDKPCVGQ